MVHACCSCVDMCGRRPSQLPAWLQRFLLYQLADSTIEPFGETAQQVFARVSALREALTGTGLLDQGLVNTDPRRGSSRPLLRTLLDAHQLPLVPRSHTFLLLQRFV